MGVCSSLLLALRNGAQLSFSVLGRSLVLGEPEYFLRSSLKIGDYLACKPAVDGGVEVFGPYAANQKSLHDNQVLPQKTKFSFRPVHSGTSQVSCIQRKVEAIRLGRPKPRRPLGASRREFRTFRIFAKRIVFPTGCPSPEFAFNGLHEEPPQRDLTNSKARESKNGRRCFYYPASTLVVYWGSFDWLTGGFRTFDFSIAQNRTTSNGDCQPWGRPTRFIGKERGRVAQREAC